MQPLDWNDLQDFLAVARTGGLARAGVMMAVDATTVSRRLRRLEARLGQTLFERTPTGRVLTEAGERLLRHVETMERAAQRIEERSRAARGLAGTVRISVSEGFGAWLARHHLGRFAADHPGLTIDLVASGAFLNPSRRETDIAIMLARPAAGPVVAAKLTDYALGVYAAAGLVRGDDPADAAALARGGQRLIGYVPELLYAPELDYLREIDERLAAQVRSTSIIAQAALIAAGEGLGVLPCFLADDDPGLLRLLPAVELTRSFWIVTHQDTRQLQRVRAVRRWLIDTVRAEQDALLGRRRDADGKRPADHEDRRAFENGGRGKD